MKNIEFIWNPLIVCLEVCVDSPYVLILSQECLHKGPYIYDHKG
jgi:hypothetical protein